MRFKKIEEQEPEQKIYLSKIKDNNTTQVSTNQKETSMWDRIKSIANDTIRIGQNTFLGGKSGYLGGTEFTKKVGDANLSKNQTMFRNENSMLNKVMDSTQLTDAEKDFYKSQNRTVENAKKAGFNTENMLPVMTNKQMEQINNGEIDVNKINKIATTDAGERLIEQDKEKILENTEKQSNVVTKKLAELAPSIGNMAVGGAVSSANPVMGGIYFGMSSTYDYYTDAKQRGMSDDQAFRYGALMAGMEGATESVSWANFTKAGSLVKGAITGNLAKGTVKEATKEVAKTGLKEALKDFGIGVGENFVQESIMEPISEGMAYAVGGKDTVDTKDLGARMLQSGIDGALTAIITGGASVGIQTCIAVEEKISNGKIPTQQEIKTAVEEASKRVNVEKALQDGVQNALNLEKNNNQQQTIPQQQNIAQNGNIERINNIEGFNGYTQKEIENIKSDKISIAQSNEDISNFVNNSRKAPGNFKMYLGKITESVSNTIKNTLGINVDNYNISLKTDDVRKIFKDHGSEKTEIPRGQIPITENDFLNIPNIINNPDTISESGKSPQGKPVIKFEKNINGNNVVVTYVSDKHNNLELQTMYKFKNNKKIDSATALHENQTPGLNTSKMDSGTNLFINNSIPQNEQIVKSDTITNNYMQNNENDTKQTNLLANNNQNVENNMLKVEQQVNLPTKGEKVELGYKPEGNKKERKHYKSIIESSQTTKEAKAIARKLMGTDTYVPDSNTKQLERANTRIENSTPESELDSLLSRSRTGGKIDATDIAVGERLIQYYSLIGDKARLQDAIQATAMAGTTAGRTVQAMSLLNHQTPEGQAIWIQRSVEKLNNELTNKNPKSKTFDFTPDMQEKIVNSKNKAELEQNLAEVYKELGQQVPKSLGQQIDSWRYFAMLGNPRTHIRNMVGNLLMGNAQDVKNKVAGAIEGTVAKFNPDMERNYTVKKSSKEVLEFAKNDIKNVGAELGLSDNKYKPQSRIENAQRTFKSDVMENTLGRLFNLNDTLLEAEDGLGLKAGYKKALAQYITANNIDIKTITDQQLAKARKFAIQEAQERTFHQANSIASALNSFFGKNKTTKAIGDAIMPFVKTPANVAKTGIEYGPAGLAKSIVYDTVQLRKGNIDANQYINNISKGLTGSAITVLGYALAQADLLKASGSDDDKKEKFDQQNGKQAYSIQIGDNTYSLDWLAPVGIPLMVGAEIYETLSAKSKNEKDKANDDEKTLDQVLERAEVLTNSLTTTLDPMVEMSMISGLVSSLKSFSTSSTQGISDMLTNAGKSYANQFVPTLLGQVAKTTDTVDRDTTSTKKGTLSKAVDSTINQVKSKVPGLRQTLPTKKDIWGQDVKLADNWPQRFFEAGVLPASKKQINNDKVVKSLNDLYDKIGESSILPTTIDKTFKISGTDYRMTNEEYNKYKKEYGDTSYKLLNNLVERSDYKKLSDSEKQKAIENVYSYAKERNKISYAKANNIKVVTTKEYNEMSDEQKANAIVPSTVYTTMEVLKKEKGKQSDYLSYLGATNEASNEKEKLNILTKANYSETSKSVIYENTIGKDDKNYPNIKKDVSIGKYLEYKDSVNTKKNEKVSSGELKDSQDLKTADKIQILLDGKYTDKEKTSLYEYTIKSNIKEDSLDEFKIIKSSNININQYLKYKQQEFKSDKEDDGTLAGKSVSGSKRDKFVNYINSMNITANQRLLLYALEGYSTTSSQKRQLVDYVKGLDLDNNYKTKLYGKFSGFTIYKDGTIKY